MLCINYQEKKWRFFLGKAMKIAKPFNIGQIEGWLLHLRKDQEAGCVSGRYTPVQMANHFRHSRTGA